MKEQRTMEGLPARRAALKVIRQVTEDGAYASLALDAVLKNSGLSGSVYYKPTFDNSGALSSRGTCYFLEITHIVEKK